jgi:hypothetical protein
MLKSIIIFFLLCSSAFAQFPPVEFTEEDGDPSTYPYKVKFPNGTVTDNGDATTSIKGYTTVPATATSSCSIGQWSATSGFFYTCVSTDTWERVAIATWSIVSEQVIFAGEDVIFAGENVFYP